MRSGDKRSALANDLAAAMGDSILMRARLLTKAITGIYDDKLRSFGITSGQFNLLAAINRGPITRAEIARVQHLHKSTLTRDLKAVLSAGWIEEVRENADGRSRPVALTRAGKELILNAHPAWLAAQAQAEEILGRDGRNALMSITDRINQTRVQTKIRSRHGPNGIRRRACYMRWLGTPARAERTQVSLLQSDVSDVTPQTST